MAPEASVIVIDNHSSDDTLATARKANPQANIIANSVNRGFACAVNQGASAAGHPDFLLLLNPDAVLLTGLDTLISSSRQYGIAAGKLVDEAGIAQTGFNLRRLPTPAALIFECLGLNRLWPSNPINRHYRYLDRSLDQAGPAEQPAGAFMMIRGDVWDQLGGMDEQFAPVWFEDVDFCQRAQQAGIKIEYVPQVVAKHAGGHSVRKMQSGERAERWYVSLLKYSRKHFRPLEFKGVCAAVMIGSLPRMLAAAIQERKLSPIPTYMHILLVAARGLVVGTVPVSKSHLLTAVKAHADAQERSTR